jgi:hypothetical protein
LKQVLHIFLLQVGQAFSGLVTSGDADMTIEWHFSHVIETECDDVLLKGDEAEVPIIPDEFSPLLIPPNRLTVLPVEPIFETKRGLVEPVIK